jgi:hypothetical protein
MAKHLFDRETDVPGDLAEQDGRDVSPLVEGHGCGAAVGMPELFVRPSLASLREAEVAKDGDNLSGLENRRSGHS